MHLDHDIGVAYIRTIFKTELMWVQKIQTVTCFNTCSMTMKLQVFNLSTNIWVLLNSICFRKNLCSMLVYCMFFIFSRNDLERQYLEMLQFNINVGSSVYAKYYFDLRALADANDLSFPLEPLSKDRALKLEVITCSINAKNTCLSYIWF